MGRTSGAVRRSRDRDALRVRSERPEGDPRPRRDHAARPGASLRADGSAPVAWGDGAGPVLLVPTVPGWSNYRTPVQGLYLCGAGTHPGGGVSGAPGYNGAHAVLEDWPRLKLH